MFVINIVNSMIGKKGNIGVRTAKIIDELDRQGIKNYSLSRGCLVKGYKNRNMSYFGHIPRILNAFRIYVYQNFNHRLLDIWLFEKFVFIFLKEKRAQNSIAHLWEFSPRIISVLKDKGYTVILDVPIAPSITVKGLIGKCENSGLLFHEENNKFEQESFLLADHLIVPSEFVRDELIKCGVPSRKITINNFGVDFLDEKNQRILLSQKIGIDYCFAGMINSRKGVETLLKVWNTGEFKNDRLHLCGRLTAKISKLLKSYKFDNVILPGFVNTKEYFKKCDVYVFPSMLEGSSKSIFEAMNAGLPIITTRNSGSVIRHGVDGFIINVCDEEDLKDKMLIIKNDSELRCKMSNNSYNHSLEYSWERYAERAVDIYRDFLDVR